MLTRPALVLIGGLLFYAVPAHAGPVLKVLGGEAGVSLLRNGTFESAAAGKFEAWNPAPQGCQVAAGEGRQGSQALRCDSPQGRGWYGASQVFQLNRTQIAPLLVRGWSRAEQVSGGADHDYSLYVDLVYTDGTPQWGQVASFRCGTHDWERRELTILPNKPVRTLTLYCLFRNHAGRVWFDDVELVELQAGADAVIFQGVPVRLAQPAGQGSLWTSFFRKEADQAQALRLAGPGGSAARWPTLFLARDVAANSDFFAFNQGACPELGLDLKVTANPHAEGFDFQGRLRDTSGRDRAITLVFAWPAGAKDWQWGDDVRRHRAIGGSGDFINQVSVRWGATGGMSLYPLAAIWGEDRGLALGLDMAQPAAYRLGYQAGLQVLYLAYDFGLSKDTQRFPGAADFRLTLFPFDPRWGFRGAWQRFMDIFPDHFQVRSREQGLWMPFTDVSRVQGWQDFGFRYHEGNNNVPWDDEHGVLSFRYTEPMTWWMAMKKEAPRTLAEVLRVRDGLLAGQNANQRRMAGVSQTAAMWDEAGEPCLRFLDTPWCNGAVWSLNPNPFLAQPAGATSDATRSSAAQPPLNAATVHWNDALKQQLYGPQARGRLDGEYLDSLEGYVTAEVNFRPDHFRATTVPLTFSADTRQPVLCKGLAVFEFTKWISEDVHRMGKLMFANGVPYRFSFLCPWLDVLGTETDWLSGGRYRPATLAQMDLWRTLAGGKPYLLLMNTDYDKFTPDLVEKYFQRCLFYGMWPGFFSHNASENPYWQRPAWYNRDRPLFQKYIPLIRKVAQAGWQPLTRASTSQEALLVERFGPSTEGAVYLTLFNDTPQAQAGTLKLELRELGFPARPRVARELLSGQDLPGSSGGWEFRLASQEARVIELLK